MIELNPDFGASTAAESSPASPAVVGTDSIPVARGTGPRSVLVIDDNHDVLKVIGRYFELAGWTVFRAANGESGLASYDREWPDVVILDLRLPDVTGMDLLSELRHRDRDAAVIMLTGHGDIDTAVQAMRLGAETFLTKPVDFSHLHAVADRAHEKAELRRRNRYLAEKHDQLPSGLEALGSSRLMQDVAKQVQAMAASDTTVLLLGETGAGKGWVARLIHSLSSRADRAFIDVNCAGIGARELEAELFGYESGALPSRVTRKRGLLEMANTGTIFLDEVGDCPQEVQPKLLRLIDSSRFRRLGGTSEIEVDVRVIAATKQLLDRAVAEGRFRDDLYYRLAVWPLRLPPLRSRGSKEVAELAQNCLLDLRRRAACGPVRISAEAIEQLARYPWPGNIRELRSVLERALLLAADAEEVRPEHLPVELVSGHTSDLKEVKLTLDEVQRRHINRVLVHHGGNRSGAARSLGIGRTTLYEKISRYGLD